MVEVLRPTRGGFLRPFGCGWFIGDWHPNIGDPTLADAICDQLLHNAYKIELRGDSMRKDESGSTASSLVANQKNGEGGNLQMTST